jgi:hypothetical protein
MLFDTHVSEKLDASVFTRWRQHIFLQPSTPRPRTPHPYTENGLRKLVKPQYHLNPNIKRCYFLNSRRGSDVGRMREALSRLPIMRQGHVISYSTLTNKARRLVLP